MAGGVGQGLAHHGDDAARHHCRRLGLGGAVHTYRLDAAARAQHVEGGGQLLTVVGQSVDGAAHGVEGLVQATVQGSEVGDDAGLLAVDDLEGLDLQQEAGQEVADAVVDLAGDAGALGQGGGAQLVVLGLEQLGVRVLKGEDLLTQVVAHHVQAPSRRLLLDGAQRQEGRERTEHQGQGQHGSVPNPGGNGGHEGNAGGYRRHSRTPGRERTETGQDVDDQRRPGHGVRQEGSHQEVGGRHGDPPLSLVGAHAQAGDGHGRDQPDHGGRLHLPHEQDQQEATAQQHAFVGQNLHPSIIGRWPALVGPACR